MAGIIQSYGLYWKASQVYWGSRGRNGSLLGCPAKARRAEPTDFGLQIGIYALYRDHHLIYVGQTGAGNQKLYARLKRHRSDILAGRWDQFSWFGLRRALNTGRLSMERLRTSAGIALALDHIEGVLIAATEPALNKQGGRFGQSATRFLQVRDERLGLSEARMIQELWENLEGKQ